MKQKINLPSGNVLELDYTSFKNTQELIKSISNVLKSSSKDFKIDSNFINLNKNDLKNMIIDKLFTILPDALGNDDLINSIIKCADNSTINNEERVTLDYFNNVDNRQDYFKLMFEVVKFNLSPFFSKNKLSDKKNKRN